MWFLYLLSWVATIVQIVFVTLAIGERERKNEIIWSKPVFAGFND